MLRSFTGLRGASSSSRSGAAARSTSCGAWPAPASICQGASGAQRSSIRSTGSVRDRALCVRVRWSRQDASEGLVEDTLMPPETFYDLLNVPPTASRRKIRQAYLDVMKECHPDKSNAEAHDFAVMINEIYETLSDPQKRAAYDAITGLAEDSINPFTDTTHERDQVFVDEVACVGCHKCANVCPASYKIEEFHGRARAIRQNADTPEKLQESIDTCPVSCIHWVSAPQLALLEQTMARMERVAVWSMFMGAGSAKNVFLEASLAWEKRQSNARRMRAAAAAADSSTSTPWGKWWGNVTSSWKEGAAGSRFYDNVNKARNGARWGAAADDGGSGAGSSDDDWMGAEAASGGEQQQAPQQPLSERQARHIATLAARAARASRTWRTYQEVSQRLRNRPLQLTAVTARGELVVVAQGKEPSSSASSGSSMSDS